MFFAAARVAQSRELPAGALSVEPSRRAPAWPVANRIDPHNLAFVRLLFATDRLHVPDDYSGSVQSTHALIRGLVQCDHECKIVASLPRKLKHFAATLVYKLH